MAAGCPGMEGSTMPLQLMLIANAITLVKLPVPNNCFPINGRVHREVVVKVIRCTMKHLIHLSSPKAGTSRNCKWAPCTSHRE